MGSAVTTGKAWHAHTMRTYLCRHDSPNFWHPAAGRRAGNLGALVLLPWQHGSVQGLAPQPVRGSPAKRCTKIGSPQQGCIVPDHRWDVWEERWHRVLIEITRRTQTIVSAAPPLSRPVGLCPAGMSGLNIDDSPNVSESLCSLHAHTVSTPAGDPQRHAALILRRDFVLQDPLLRAAQ